MSRLTRRQFLSLAASLGISAAWAQAPRPSSTGARERRDLFAEGVASGDPNASSVLLWTRRPYPSGEQARLRVEVSEDEAFTRVVATARSKIRASGDWTCRVLVGNLKSSKVYWYRFFDDQGNSSRLGRTRTAPAENDPRPARFAFVSCQNINVGAQNAYRRMIHDDERASNDEQLEFVLHLGDFVYEVVWYPEDRPQGYFGRRVRDVVRYPHGEKIGDIHIPATLEDYRTLYQAYLHDPDIQDARARWPFVCIWDNHEFSQAGWQSIQVFNGEARPVQTRKLAANQAWFEYQPARIAQGGRVALEQFAAPSVRDAPIRRFDEGGFGDEPKNRAAVASLTGYRALRWGQHIDLILTDQWSYRSQPPSGMAEAAALADPDFPQLVPEGVLEVLDAGRTHDGGKPPASLRYGAREIANFRRDAPAQTLLGARQKRWFLDRLTTSSATWKIWGASLAALDSRVDLQNLPAGFGRPWPDGDYAASFSRDYSSAYLERAEIYAAVREAKVGGFAIVSGDRHSFWAGLAAPSLPPKPFEPVGVAFVTGSVSMTTLVDSLKERLPRTHPMRDLYLTDGSRGGKVEPTINLLMRHGVRSAIEYAQSGDLARALERSNPLLAPHLCFLDQAGHGYATVRAAVDVLECEFVCIPSPGERAGTADGGPLLYRVRHRVPLWKTGARPVIVQQVIEGDPFLS